VTWAGLPPQVDNPLSPTLMSLHIEPNIKQGVNYRIEYRFLLLHIYSHFVKHYRCYFKVSEATFALALPMLLRPVSAPVVLS